MSSELPAWVRRTLSEPRFAAYLRAAVGDAEVALRLYWWNIEVSAAFYGLLHCLELSLRNALHHQLGNRFGPSIRRGVRVDVDDIVAGLPFGFWVSLLSRGAAYDRQLWVPALHRAFPGYSGRREKLHDNLLAMVLFRNRIMHHEPIHHRDLAADHAKIYRLLGYLSPDLAKEVQAFDRVPGYGGPPRVTGAGVRSVGTRAVAVAAPVAGARRLLLDRRDLRTSVVPVGSVHAELPATGSGVGIIVRRHLQQRVRVAGLRRQVLVELSGGRSGG